MGGWLIKAGSALGLVGNDRGLFAEADVFNVLDCRVLGCEFIPTIALLSVVVELVFGMTGEPYLYAVLPVVYWIIASSANLSFHLALPPCEDIVSESFG